MSGGGFKASIPNSMRKMIQNIKEITGNHSDEDVYAMLKECSMDPNETTQKLLLQDTFHEVKRKRDRRKENLNSRESVESRWRPGTQGRGPRGGRGNFSSHNASHDAGGSKNSGMGKDTGTPQVTEKVAPSLPAAQEPISKEKSSGTSSASIVANGPISDASGTASGVNPSSLPAGSGHRMDPSSCTNNNLDTVLVSSSDSWVPGAVGAIRRDLGSQRPPGDSKTVISAEKKLTAASETAHSSIPGSGRIQVKSQGAAKNHLTETSSTSSAVTHGSPSTSRPSSNYGSRSQQMIGPQRVGSNKEWKPKGSRPASASSRPASASGTTSVSTEVTGQSQTASGALVSEEATSELQKKLEDLHLPQRQHVILPNHIFVPESEKNKFSFGSLGITFGGNTSYASGPESEKSSTPSETCQAVEETVEEQASSQNAAVTSEVGDYSEHPQSPANAAENLSSSEVDGSSSAIQEYNESKQDTALPSGGQQYSGAHTSPNYSFGLMPPMLSTQATPFDNSDSDAHDTSRLPSYVVHHPIDPASYYGQFYRSGPDSDGRLSPFNSAGVATKYNGNVAVLPTPNSQSPKEGGVLSTASPTPLVTQAAGLMQSSIAVTQQPVPVFRPPSGVHISHYPPNYFPYGPYFSPFYVPPPIHHFMGNGAFPQQPQASTVYPPPPAVAATGMKYPLSQFKPGGNTANPTHLVMPGGYGAYGSSPAGYNHSSATSAGNSTSNEDLGSSQFKESNMYLGGQQSEGSAVWVAAPGRDMSNLPTSSFYNLPPQGPPHMTFAPPQAGHGTFASIYHPGQAVTAAAVHPMLQQPQTMAGAVDMVGPGGNVYQQQPQHPQINWPSNY